MTDYNQNKKCERCSEPVPNDYQNLLCDKCYQAITAENDRARVAAVEQYSQSPTATTNPERIAEFVPIQGIQDPNYKPNPEKEDKDQVLTNIAQFVYTHVPEKGRIGVLLYYPERNMYTYMRNYCREKAMAHPQYPKMLWKPSIIDVGCGSGVGSNVMSQEADFVWGIDKNEMSVQFAKEAFTREKNGIYYTPQVTFDIFDILKDSRTVMQFDIVVAIEVIEHIEDAEGFLRAMMRFVKRDKQSVPLREWGTEFFISTPNRNSPKIRKDHPDNPFHVREWTAQEFKTMLLQFFEEVRLLNNKGEPISDEAMDDVVFTHCLKAKL